MTEALPIIDVGAFLEKRASAAATAREIEKACREFGFFYATGHGVGGETVHALKDASARFFALPETSKMEVAIARGGRAWRGYFPSRYTSRPTLLFRIFHYPPSAKNDGRWGVGEHTDYGLLTLLAQDDAGGLQVKTAHGWLEAPPIPETLVCNIGDMLDRLTG